MLYKLYFLCINIPFVIVELVLGLIFMIFLPIESVEFYSNNEEVYIYRLLTK